MKLLIIVIALVFFIIGKIAHYLLFSDSAIKRRLKGKKAMSIASLKNETDVKVCGKIINPENVILTPITQKECVWFRLEVFNFDTGWVSIANEINMSNFEIKDNTASAKVISGYMEVAVGNINFEEEKITEAQKVSVLKFLEQKKALTAPLFASDSRLRFREKWLPVDSDIIIKGKCYIENGEKTIRSNKIKSMYIARVD